MDRCPYRRAFPFRGPLTPVVVVVMLAVASCEAPDGERQSAGAGAPAAGHAVSCAKLARFVARTRRGHVPGRSADLALVPHEPNYIGTPEEPVHSGPFDSLAEVPLVLYGPGQIPRRGEVEVSATLADVAPTIARLIGFEAFEAPSGRVLRPALGASAEPPRVVVVVVWDGAGWNTLRAHRRSWPFLRRLMSQGVSFVRATIGSTPSVTPPIHTTLGTGAFPRIHGIPSVRMTTADGDYIDPFEGNSPRYIEVPTLADRYDVANGNEPLIGVVATVNWHLGMIGRGALLEGGDRDLAVLLNSAGTVYGDPSIYEIPGDLSDPGLLLVRARTLDASDGLDGRWRGHALDDPGVRYATPATVEFQQAVLERALTRRGFGADDVPDLLFSNFKSIDDAGHRWGMGSREMREVIAATDAALRDLVAALDDLVGRGRWAVVVTADHGTARRPERSGAWAIRGRDLEADLNRAFDVEGPPVVERVNSSGVFLDERQRARVDLDAMGKWLLDYTARDNLYELDAIPAYYEDRADVPLFDAVLAEGRVVARSCRRGGRRAGDS